MLQLQRQQRLLKPDGPTQLRRGLSHREVQTLTAKGPHGTNHHPSYAQIAADQRLLQRKGRETTRLIRPQRRLA